MFTFIRLGQYDSLTDRITTANYEVGFNETGQLADVIIGGSGIDIFDRLKVRLMGSYWILPPAEIYENNVKMYYAYAKVGPVRVIRNMHGLITFEYFDVYKDEAEFTQTSFFYPWHGVFTLFGIPIKKLANIIEIDGFRVSWDFNRNAEGMTFYNEFNKNGVIINGEGRTDDIDRSCFPDELNWNLGTGDIGTILNIFHVPPLGDNIRTYYFDDTTGTTGDDEGKKIDTGDKMSFGDNGFSLEKNLEDDAKKEDTLKVEYYNFFLPPNFNSDDASLICEQLKEPLNYETRIQKLPRPSGVAKSPDFVPNDFELYQNYPNPFNAATTIAFALPRKTPVALRIYDTLGRMVATLVDRTLPQGIHHYIWQGRDEQGWSIPTGLYIYKLETAEFNSTKKLLLIK